MERHRDMVVIALVTSYRLSIVTMMLTEAIWPQLTMQIFRGTVSTPIRGNEGS